MSGEFVTKVDFLELRDRVLKLEESLAELAKWTKFNKQHENKGTVEDPAVDVGGVATSDGDVENIGRLEVMDANNQEQMKKNDVIDTIEIDETYSSILEASSIPLQDEDVEYESRMSPAASGSGGGSGSGILEERFDDQEEMQRRMDCSSEEGDSSCSESGSQDEDDEDWSPPTKWKNGRSVVNQSKKDKERIPPPMMIQIETDVCQNDVEHGKDSLEEVARTDVVQKEAIPQRMIVAEDATIEFRMDDCKEKDEQANAEGNDDQGTSDDILPPILEAVSSIQSLDESTEYEMPFLTPEIGHDQEVCRQVEQNSKSDSSSGDSSISNESSSSIELHDDEDENEDWMPSKGAVNGRIVVVWPKVKHGSDPSSGDSISNEAGVSSIEAEDEDSIAQDDKQGEMDHSSGDSSCSESSSSIDQNDDDEGFGWMPSLTAENGVDVVNQSENSEGNIPLAIITKRDRMRQREVKDGSASSVEGSAKKKIRRSLRKKSVKSVKSPTAKKNWTKTPSAKKKKKKGAKSQLKCPHCSKTWISKYQLSMHIRSHTGERPFRCPHCPMAMTQAGHLKNHVRKLHPSKNQNAAKISSKCPHCCYRTTLESQLKVHIRNRHPNAGPTALRGGPLKKIHKIHKIHKKRSERRCYFCSYSTVYNSSLVSHVRIHTGERPFSCPLCPYAANQAGILKTHLKKHKVKK